MKGISRTRNAGDVLKSLYHESAGLPYYGIYVVFGPGLLLRDPELIKLVLTKDFSSFSARGFKINPKLDPLSGNQVY